MPKRRDKNKVKAVVKEYIRNGLDMTMAVAKIENKAVNQAVSNKAYRWKLSPEVIAEIKAEVSRFDKTLVNESFVLYKLYEVINDDGIKYSDKVNALGLCSKILGMAKEQGNTNNLAIFGDVLGELKAVSVKSMPVVEQKPVTNTPITDVSTTNV